ncbi:MAG: hypothetical protein HY749_16105 [Gammaproteobacteria bacterium]|nr:hypothetical protein [Gammaproteobacteria bacterium]
MSPDATFEDWFTCGETLKRMDKAVQFWIGDWLIQGEVMFPDRYSQALEATGASYTSLRAYAWVARAIPPDMRSDALSWSVHREIAALPEPVRETTIAKAVEEDWSARRAHAEVREATRDPAPKSEEPADGWKERDDFDKPSIDPMWLPKVRALSDHDLLAFIQELLDHGWEHARRRLGDE